MCLLRFCRHFSAPFPRRRACSVCVRPFRRKVYFFYLVSFSLSIHIRTSSLFVGCFASGSCKGIVWCLPYISKSSSPLCLRLPADGDLSDLSVCAFRGPYAPLHKKYDYLHASVPHINRPHGALSSSSTLLPRSCRPVCHSTRLFQLLPQKRRLPGGCEVELPVMTQVSQQ